jgi:tetratricopeptide (TPR) repeat protein
MAFSRVMTFALIITAAGCETEYGHKEILSSGTDRSVQTRPGEAVPTIQPEAVTPPQIAAITPPSAQNLNLPKSIEETSASPAVQSLYRKAEAARSAGKADQAEASLIRALRIDPRNAFVWQSLARVHLSERLYDQALNEARKSSSFARGNPYVESANLRIVADVRDARGDAAGALQARMQADDLINGTATPQ